MLGAVLVLVRGVVAYNSGLAAAAFRYATDAPETCVPLFPPDVVPCGGRFNHRVLVAAMVSYEADTIRMALAEATGVADVLLVETLWPHNKLARRYRKPAYVWPLRVGSMFEQNVSWRSCEPRRMSDGRWDAETDDNACVTRHVNAVKHRYDVVIVGSVDEILSRDNLLRLKHCALPPLPASGAIGMPLGLLGRSFRTDWHIRSMPYSFSLPSVWPASDPSPRRHIPPLPGTPPIVGGLHATNYCFLPAIVLKELWTTSYSGRMTRDRLCGTSVHAHKERCYNMLHHRVVARTGPETVVPRLLEACPHSFPSWRGDVDMREMEFYSKVCG